MHQINNSLESWVWDYKLPTYDTHLIEKSPDCKGVPRMMPKGYNGVPVDKVAQSL